MFIMVLQLNKKIGESKKNSNYRNNVQISIDFVIAGKITIGDDVLLAPNSYVNCDIPSHSIVYGNPCVIKKSGNIIEYYIDKQI